jgi:hypothetical protein
VTLLARLLTSLAAILLAAVTLTACGAASSHNDIATRAAVVPNSERIGGRTLSAWEMSWWRWRISLSAHHAAPSPGVCVTLAQHLPVWFLHGDSPRSHSSTRRCPIPRGDYLLVGAPSIDCSTVEPSPFHASTDAGLVRCAERDWNASEPHAAVTVDGVALNPAAVRVTTPAFAFVAPRSDNMFGLEGRTSGRMAVMGLVAMLRPLSVGRHTVVTELQYKGAEAERVVYQITSN